MRAAYAALVIAVISLGASGADAKPQREHRFAVATNFWGGWVDGNSIGASAYARIASRHAIRANLATHSLGWTQKLFSSDSSDEPLYAGRTVDVGIGWMWCPRRLFDGLTLEVGVLHRNEDVRRADAARGRVRYDAGRVLIGWSWLIADRAFLAVAVGMSRGYARGHALMFDAAGSVDEFENAGEGYLRFGVAF
jgi:hypothetical protein